MSSPLVTIIIPVYNAEAFLPKCIESIISQSYSNFELLLVDDCSTDNSYSICQSYSSLDSRLLIIRNNINKGVTITRNLGLDNAKGEYILFIDNDDYIDNNYIETFINALQDYDDVDLLTQNIVFHYQGEEPFVETNQLSLGGPWGKLFKRSIIENHQIRFIPGLKYNEDNLFILDYLEHSNNHFNIQYAGYHYIIHNSCTSKKLENDYIETGKGLSIILKRLETNSFKDEYNRSFAENRCSFIFHRYITALFFQPLENQKKRKNNYKDVIVACNDSHKYYPKIYKSDYLIVILLKLHFYSISFYLSDFLFFVRLKLSKPYSYDT